MFRSAGHYAMLFSLLGVMPVMLIDFVPGLPSARPAQNKVQPEIPLKINYYDIEGENRQELIDNMYVKGPIDETGERRFAAVNWQIKWNWPLGEGQKPDYAASKIQPQITVTLPRLKNFDKAHPELQNTWREYSEKLIRHEKNHIKHAEQAYYEIQQKLSDIARYAPDMDYSEVNLLIKEIVRSARRKDVVYDQKSKNGYLEGVSLK